VRGIFTTPRQRGMMPHAHHVAHLVGIDHQQVTTT
jgi:hypothetical protein